MSWRENWNYKRFIDLSSESYLLIKNSKKMALPLAVLLVATSVHAIQNITCPILSCTNVDRLTPGVCFEHDGVVPTKKLMGAQC